ncbi:hypothetical protein BDQ17DRAFT_1330415 [Cyathus striatus]|nr:hypothetical protein BDQ17DRAFT_1330415 [Cyathus striatus]
MLNNQHPPVKPGHPYYSIPKRLNHNWSQSLVNELPDAEDSQVSGAVDKISGLCYDTPLSGSVVPLPPSLPLSIPSYQAPEMDDRVSGLYHATLNSSLTGPSPMLQASTAAWIMLPGSLPPLPLVAVAQPSSVNGHHLTLYGPPSTVTKPQATAVLLSNISMPVHSNPGLSSPPDVPAPTHLLHFHMEINGMASSHQDLPSGMEIDPSLLLH